MKTTTIYNNYDLFDDENTNVAKEILLENGFEAEEITDELISSVIYDDDAENWEAAKTELENYFEGKTVIIYGNVGRWNGNFAGGIVTDDFIDGLYKAIKDCDYISITDSNGHLYIKSTHHDGTNYFEVREVTEKGIDYLNNWEYNWNDDRSKEYIHGQIVKRYSHLPNFAKVNYYSYSVQK